MAKFLPAPWQAPEVCGTAMDPAWRSFQAAISRSASPRALALAAPLASALVLRVGFALAVKTYGWITTKLGPVNSFRAGYGLNAVTGPRCGGPNQGQTKAGRPGTMRGALH